MENKEIITQTEEVVELVPQLPAEVAQIAQNVSTEKKAEVQKVLNHVFGGIAKMRETIDNITVVDENDKRAMAIAKQARLSVKDTRLDAVRDLDAKRAEVQKEMLSYKTEDALWLKTKQIVEILTKELEAEARWKEETKQRFDAQQREINIQQRIDKVSKFAPEISRTEFENMSEETFIVFLSGIEKAYNDQIELCRIVEEKRLQDEKLERERIEFQRLENERLKKEAEEKSIRDEKRHNELRPYIVFIRDYNKMLLLPDSDYQRELEEIIKGAQLQWEFERAEQLKAQQEAEAKEKQLKAERAEAEAKQKAIEEKARIEREEQEKKLQAERAEAKRLQDLKDAENAKLQAELQAKKDAELKAQQEAERIEVERIKAEEIAKKAPAKEKLNTWVDEMTITPIDIKSFTQQQRLTANDIFVKFESFKKWAKNEIEKL